MESSRIIVILITALYTLRLCGKRSNDVIIVDVVVIDCDQFMFQGDATLHWNESLVLLLIQILASC